MLGLLPTLLTYTADCSLEKQINNRDSKTNIVFILADDMGYNDISLHNGGAADGSLQTPHIDSLADSGIWFSRGYAANATCAHLELQL